MQTTTTQPSTITEWVQACHAVAKARGWHDSPREIGTVLALIHSEVSEALEEVRNHNPRRITISDGKPEGYVIELADVLIRIFDEVGARGLDLEQALRLKHAYNQTRPHRHGGKNF